MDFFMFFRKLVLILFFLISSKVPAQDKIGIPKLIFEDYAFYEDTMEKIQEYYGDYPISHNLSPLWYKSLAYPSSAIVKSKREFFDINFDFPPSTGGGTWYQRDNGDLWVMASYWSNSPSMGTAVLVEYSNDDINLFAQRTEGGMRVHKLKNKDGSYSFISPGVDEGKLIQQRDENGDISVTDGSAWGFIYELNKETKQWVSLGYKSAAHGSRSFDYQNDGDDDLILQNYTSNPDEAGDILINNDSEFEYRPFPNILDAVGKMFIAPEYWSDGKIAMVFTDPTNLDDLGISSKYNVLAIYDENLDASPVIIKKLPLAYFDRDEFSTVDNEYNWDTQSHDINAKLIDLDYDGDLDIVISSKLTSEKIAFSTLQILINYNDEYLDETDSRLFNYSMVGGGAHYMDFNDVNDDGFVDIILHDRGDVMVRLNWETDFYNNSGIGGAPRILVNDGTGHFVVIAQHLISRDIGGTPPMIPSILHDGKLRFTQINQNYKTGPWIVETVDFKYRYSTGPNGLDPSQYGEPYFNEFYYLLHNKVARDALEFGKYETGLDHYLKEGKSLGLKTNAYTDTDNDGFIDKEDIFPLNALEWLDTDNDGIGNNEDLDDDNDGFIDIEEADYGSDPLDKASQPIIGGSNLILIKAVLDAQEAKSLQ